MLLVQRPDKGLLASMLEPPLGPWSEDFPSQAQALKQAPFEAQWKRRPGIVRHGFTHFELEIEVYVAEAKVHPPLEGGSKMPKAFSGRGEKTAKAPSPKNPRAVREDFSASTGRTGLRARPSDPSRGEAKWVLAEKLRDVALPTVMRKIVEHGLADDGPLFRPSPRSRKP
ncbi:MAG TPA: NUDIX domain-containing protein [Rhizomicrobium sp.]|nr:NUDIX domain-containing protein [Rhizomicrobium sp.]